MWITNSAYRTVHYRKAGKLTGHQHTAFNVHMAIHQTGHYKARWDIGNIHDWGNSLNKSRLNGDGSRINGFFPNIHQMAFYGKSVKVCRHNYLNDR